MGVHLIDRADALATFVVCSQEAVAQRPVPKVFSWRPGAGRPMAKTSAHLPKKLVLHVYGVLSSRIIIDEMETPIINQIPAVLRGLVPSFQDGHSSNQSDKATISELGRP